MAGTRAFSAFEWMIAGRYLRSKRQDGFISVISGFSLIGIALGVATLIIVMSVMNGFRADLIGRVEKTLAFLKALTPAQIDGTDTKKLTIKVMGKDTDFVGIDLLQNRALPNFYFHVTTAYDILRINGIEIGKRDFMGATAQ